MVLTFSILSFQFHSMRYIKRSLLGTDPRCNFLQLMKVGLQYLECFLSLDREKYQQDLSEPFFTRKAYFPSHERNILSWTDEISSVFEHFLKCILF